jgi:hypothetical protein
VSRKKEATPFTYFRAITLMVIATVADGYGFWCGIIRDDYLRGTFWIVFGVSTTLILNRMESRYDL